MGKERQEHVAVISISTAVFTKTKSGELHGPVLNQEQMETDGVPHTKKVIITGFDRFECLKKVRDALDGLGK